MTVRIMASAVVVGMIQKTIKMLLKLAAVVAAVAVAFILFVVLGFLYRTRTVDKIYASVDDMEREPRTRNVLRYLPSTATDIHFISKARFGEYTDRFSCKIEESEFIRFAKERSYVVATNSFTKLDYGSNEQEDGGIVVWRSEQIESDAERQRQLVFGDAPAPTRFLSISDSHAFDGGAIGGSWRRIFVFDRDSDKLTGYLWANLL